MAAENLVVAMQTQADSKPGRLQTAARFRTYWKIEAFNIVLIPGLTARLVFFQFKQELNLALILNMIAVSWLLAIGTIALRMMYLNAVGDRSFERNWIGSIYYCKLPSLILVLSAVAATIWESSHTLPAITPRWGSCVVLSILAAAEYINYFHFQVQHFDNLADFERLLAGKGFRRSHLARAIARWKSRQEG
jgi:hypothetical protein